MSDFKKFASSVTKEKFARLYLIHGSEDYFIEKAVTLLIDNAVSKKDRSFNLDVFDGTESNSDNVLSSMLSFPFAGEHRLTVVRKFDKMEKRYRLDIVRHLSEVPESNIVCFVAGEIKTSDEPYNQLPSFAESVTFNKLKGTDLTGFLSDTSASLGKEMEPGAVDLLVELSGDSLGDLVSEVEKLSLYVGNKEKISIDDVNTVVGKSRNFNIFELQRAIGQKNSRRSQEIAGKMLETGEKPVYINFMLTRYFLSLLQVKHHIGKGVNTKDICTKVFGRWNPYVEEYISAARAYSVPELKRAITTLLDADVKLKTGGYRDTEAVVISLSEILGGESAGKP
ncbi:MAG: DNA polymerase III subunit delta [Bacteroidetes bacterium]|nr:DNA polymerase III subunit delta [Bacteroidota bacterium]MCL5267216.1 DNA polymerase III subunit delta [Bacteroidota bacterium]